MDDKKRAAYRKFHFIYKTTCNITGKHYFGMHSTDDLDDGYLGSGKIVRYSFKKYGRENHSKEILELLPDRESLCLREAEIIDDGKLKDPMCMNIYPGGAGPGAKPGHVTSQETKAKISAAISGNKNGRWGKLAHNRGKPMSIETRKKLSIALTGNKNQKGLPMDVKQVKDKDEFNISVGNKTVTIEGAVYHSAWVKWTKEYRPQKLTVLNSFNLDLANRLGLTLDEFWERSCKWIENNGIITS